MNKLTKSLIPLAAAGALALPAAATAGKAPALLTKCQSISVRDTHGGAVRSHTQLTPIRGGRVFTLDPATGVTAQTPFRRNSGRWLTSRNGRRYAVASTTADGSLSASGYVEKAGATTNVSGLRLENYATRTVWTNMPTHPDGAPRSPEDTTPNTYPYGYTALGAAMNDMYGVERYAPAQGGLYIDDPYHRHFIIYNGATVAAAKRPSTRPDGTPIVNSPIAWRTVAKNTNIAN